MEGVPLAKTTAELMEELQYREQPVEVYWEDNAVSMIEVNLKNFGRIWCSVPA